MKKSARINDLLFYLTAKSTFHLKELMARYKISKSTALRDIQTLEELGIPIYSEKGRYGKYVIMETKFAAPLLFTTGELYALYFALLSLKSYQSMPFDMEASRLARKYELAVPVPIRQKLKQMKQAIILQQPKHWNDSRYLSEIVEGMINESVFLICYQKNQTQKNYTGQFLQLVSQFGQWYVSVWISETKVFRTLRVDRIINLCYLTGKQGESLLTCLAERDLAAKTERNCFFSVYLNEQGKEWFQKENYPTMTIIKQKNVYKMTGRYHEAEQSFLINYLLSFGQHLLSVEPQELKTALIQESQIRLAHLKNL